MSAIARAGLFAAAALLAGLSFAFAQFPSCDRYENPIDRGRCREATGEYYPGRALPAPPQPSPPQPRPLPPLRPEAERKQELLNQRKLHWDAMVMSVRTQRGLLECLRGSDDAKRLKCYDDAIGSWHQDFVDAGLIPAEKEAR